VPETFRTLLTKIGFNVEHDKLERLEGQLEGIKKRLDVISGIEVARSLYELAERFGHVGEQLSIAAEAAGLTVDQFQKLNYAASQNGVSTEEMSKALQHVSLTLFQARTGSQEAQKAFALAGFSPGQIQSFRTSQDVLLALSDRLRGIRDPIQRAAVSQELLGRGSVRLAGFLAQGSKAITNRGQQAQRFGLILTEKEVKSLEVVEHSFQNIILFLQKIGATIVTDISPSIRDMVNDFLKFYNANKDLINLNIKAFLDKFLYGLGYVYGFVTTLFTDLKKKFSGFGDIFGLGEGSLGKIAFAGTVLAGLVGTAKTGVAVFAALDAAMSPLVVTIATLASGLLVLHDTYKLLQGGETILPKKFLTSFSPLAFGAAAYKKFFGGPTPGLNGVPLYPTPTGFPINQETNKSASVNNNYNPIFNITAPAGTAHELKEHIEKIQKQAMDVFSRKVTAGLLSAGSGKGSD